ncbi:MAG: hypothetical protein KAJ73_00705 [Zetaproteobacteria bacterium]|nr:hypothetical protein [Zetaproteobacteria bacterium]
MKQDDYVDFDKPKLDRLKIAYRLADGANMERFNFEGKVWLTTYAGHAIEYLKGKLDD